MYAASFHLPQRKIDWDSQRLPTIPSIFYFPEYITRDEEQALIDKVFLLMT